MTSLSIGGQTNVGRKRRNNQDQFLVADLKRSLEVRMTSIPSSDHDRLFGESSSVIALVADGMGGHAGGERASALVVEEMEHFILNTLQWCLRLHDEQDEDFEDELAAGLRRCQVRLQRETETHPELRGMGTTLTMAYVVWPRLYVVHAGDSRCYVLRDESITQITTDHTVAQRMVSEGMLTESEAEESPYGHVLWNALGGDSDPVVPQVEKVELHAGDRILLCSDGLTRHVDDATIAHEVREATDATSCCETLIRLANESGGRDNITVVSVFTDDQDDGQPRRTSLVDSKTIQLPRLDDSDG